MMTVDPEALAIDFLRAMRGRRSQRGLSRRLGYRTNIAYRWESGRCWPTVMTTLEALERLGMDPVARIGAFVARPLPWLEPETRLSSDLVARLLRELHGDATFVSLAERSGFSRFQLRRWLGGSSDPRLPDFFRLIESMSLRLVDFVTAFFEPTAMPSIAEHARRHQALREAAYDVPWSHAVLRVLELEDYRKLPRHRAGWIAARLGISPVEEKRALTLLAEAGQIHWNGRRYDLATVAAVDTRREPARSRQLRAFWIDQARERLLAETPGTFSYNLFSVSEADLAKIREIHLRYFHEIQSIIAASRRNERVGLFCTQFFALDAPRRYSPTPMTES